MVSDNDLESRLATAEGIVREAGQLARSHFARVGKLQVERKGLQDYVSAADREVEAVIRERLAQSFPNEAFLGEESGGEIVDPIWVADPIDGTANFLRSIPLYGTSLAFVRGGRTELGIIYLPQLDQMFTAIIDGPARQDGRPIRVRATKSLDEALVIIGYDPRRSKSEFFEVLNRLLASNCEFRRFGSATFSLCMVASGRTDAFWQDHLQPWDALAGLLIVQQAGGRMNDFLADEGLRAGSPLLAASSTIAPNLSQIFGIPLVS